MLIKQPLLIIGTIIISGFFLGELAARLKLPRITGYILAGILLNPKVSGIIPAGFSKHTDTVTNIALCFITFSVGGTLLFSKIKKLGKSIIYITLFEAEFAFLVVFLGFLAISPHLAGKLFPGKSVTWAGTFIPLSILLACLASPTDPSATLAVMHEYKAKGEVSSTVMGVAAFDDALGIINYSFAVVIAQASITHQAFSLSSSILKPFLVIGGSILLGVVMGFILNLLCKMVGEKSEGILIVIITGLITACFGVASLINLDQLLSTMVMGAVVVNYNPFSEKIFSMLERYTEELIFVVFFCISGLHLNFSILVSSLGLVFIFFVFRTIGKVLGAYTGASIGGASDKVKKYTGGGLIPQGGIVIGLALLIKQMTVFSPVADAIVNIIIGATVIHELLGPITSKWTLKKAGEINP